MRRHILRCAVVLQVCLFSISWTRAAESSIVGRWEGAFVRLNAVQTVVLELALEAGAVRGTYDIPDLGLYAEPLTDVAYNVPVLRFRLLYGQFRMQVHDDIDEMTGENPDWGPAVALHLKRVPVEPAPCRKEEIRFSNGAVALAGTLVTPRSGEPHPAIVLVHGSGRHERSDWRYRSLGDYFARHGIAALVYDKRGAGLSTGDLESATFDDLAGDAAAAFRFLIGRKEIDRRRIGMLGSSQGGWLAPLAASRLRGVAFLILDKGAAVAVREQELQRVEYGLRAGKSSETDIAEALRYTRQVFEVAYTGEGWPDLQAATQAARTRPWAHGVQLAETEKDVEGWRLERYDPAPVLRRTTIPVLALFGEKDTLVPPAGNADLMRRYLAEAGNRDVTIRIFPELGHSRYLGQSLRTGRWEWPDGYWIWDKQSPAYLDTVISWLSARLAGAATPRDGR
jgi:pimeloyl-ACP methyl ester carboxylesterase